jgi:hypothetical protein
MRSKEEGTISEMRLGQREKTSYHLGPGIFLELRALWAWVTGPDEKGVPIFLAFRVTTSNMP